MMENLNKWSKGPDKNPRTVICRRVVSKKLCNLDLDIFRPLTGASSCLHPPPSQTVRLGDKHRNFFSLDKAASADRKCFGKRSTSFVSFRLPVAFL